MQHTLTVTIFVIISVVWSYPLEYEKGTSSGKAKDQRETLAYPKYRFEYGVNDDTTGDIKEHTEERNGDVVKGEYSLIEPDGTVRRVQYQDDGKSGLIATVTRTGPKTYPPNKVALPRAVPVIFGTYRE